MSDDDGLDQRRIDASIPIVVYTTAMETGQRLATGEALALGEAAPVTEADLAVFVDPSLQFQELLGIGGAITDASAEVFAQLSVEHQQELLTAYYDPQQGNGYSLCRTSIHSCDFSSGSYTYVDEGDAALDSFSIEPDHRFRIPMLRAAIARAGGRLTLYASPWSAPAFMKDNDSMLQGGKLLDAYRDSWARYIARFIHAYEEAGIPVWGITVQNEPSAAQTWESMEFSAEEERDFLKHHLGPTLAAEGLGDRRIIVWDHNRDLAAHRALTVYADPEAAKYVWGLGFHWYETWAGGDAMQENLAAVAAAYPDKNLMFTEGCNEGFSREGYQHWHNAERYGEAMIRDFNVGTVGWTDWNILLDHNGGPNHVGNFCFAPIHADLEHGGLIYTPSYYYIGHFSRFMRPGARRLSAVSSRSHLLTTSFLNPDGQIATVVMNNRDDGQDYVLHVGGRSTALHIPARAIQTIVCPAMTMDPPPADEVARA